MRIREMTTRNMKKIKN